MAADGTILSIDERYLPVTFTAPGLSARKFRDLCQRYESYQVEYTAGGCVLLTPLNDVETSARNVELAASLLHWARSHGRGIVTGAHGIFRLPSGARYLADAAWLSKKRLRARACPEFVIEQLSPWDRRERLHAKMLEWIEGGVQLGWLVDARDRTVTIYRGGHEPEIHSGRGAVRGEGPVEGFVLDLARVWGDVR